MRPFLSRKVSNTNAILSEVRPLLPSMQLVASRKNSFHDLAHRVNRTCARRCRALIRRRGFAPRSAGSAAVLRRALTVRIQLSASRQPNPVLELSVDDNLDPCAEPPARLAVDRSASEWFVVTLRAWLPRVKANADASDGRCSSHWRAHTSLLCVGAARIVELLDGFIDRGLNGSTEIRRAWHCFRVRVLCGFCQI